MSSDVQTATVPSEPQATLEYHWVMTVQTPGGIFNTRAAVVTVPAGFTRAAVFQYVHEQFEADYGSQLTVLFFALQPNQL
ncbi:hypothetical protein ABZY36_35450 [Streptomyces sp. NPDC006627]|uniref:hypothetical protein n=1 Tax=Streptomyces sp. NPDC006627 TaxID=3154679 RepID=UPI00339F5C66